MRSLVRVQYGPLEKLETESDELKVIVNSGDIAQLVERLLCTQEVRSSNLLISTKLLNKTNESESKSLATHLVRVVPEELERLLNSSESKNLERTLKTA